MRLIQVKHLRRLTLAALLILITVSCQQSDRDLLDAVPADTQLAAKINLDKLLKMAGCQVKGNAYILSDDLDRLATPEIQAALKAVNHMRQFIDMNNVVVYGSTDSPIITFPLDNVADYVALINNDGSFTKLPDRDGFSAYQISGITLLTRDSQGWVATNPDDIVASYDKAAKHPITALPALKETLEAATPLNVAYRTSIPTLPWVLSTTQISEQKGVTTVKAADDDGKFINFAEQIPALDISALQYFPSNTQLGGAISVPAEFDWSFPADFIASYCPADTRQIFDILISILKRVNGTFAVAINPAASAKSLATLRLGAWDVTISAQMPQESATTIIDQCTRLAQLTGLRFAKHPDGFLAANLSHLNTGVAEVYIGYANGALICSTRTPAPDSSYPQGVFSGKKAGAFIDIPYRSETMKALTLPYGLAMEASLDEDRLTVTSRFNGSRSSFLPTLVNIAAGFSH